MKGWSKAAREQMEKRNRDVEKTEEPENPGVCPCGNDGSFKLRFSNHQLIRTCRVCGREKIV